VPFVHLHCHTEYSLLDSTVRPGDLVKKAAAFGMPAVAITDHGNLHAAVEFHQAAGPAGVKPVIGCEIYVAPGSMRDKPAGRSGHDDSFHLTLLALDETGYRNLVKISTAGFLEGFQQKPRVDREFLASHAAGLVALSGCAQGEVPQLAAAGREADALKAAAAHRDIFGAENYFLELHDHGLEAQRRTVPVLAGISKKLGIGLAAANDVHFLERAHHEAHDVLVCIGTGANLVDEKRKRYSPELYFKSAEEMRAAFREFPEACDNTLRIAERCSFQMEFGKPKFPNFDSPDSRSREQYLRDLCYEGLRRRYGERAGSDPALAQRLDYELSVIEKTGFTSYFLIVWDFIRHAKEIGIPVGPGRGSAAGSIIAYVLGITDIDPLRFGLIFERFLNPERVSPPDIDVDFCMDRRGEVIDYVRRKYGERAVSQIITFGTLGAKSVVRDVGRVLGWSYGEGDRIAKMIPAELNIDLAKAVEKSPELKNALETEAPVRQLWDYATVLEGLSRNAGVHAAGVVIGDRPLDEFVPLCASKDNETVTQFAMGPLTDLGLLKMDFLGLKTLTVMSEAERLVRIQDPGFQLSSIPMDDKAAFDLLNTGEVVGVFQIDGGMASWCRSFDFQSLNDIIALNALYRPGPMQFIPDYIERKKGLKKVEYIHPLLEQVCAETHGIIVYQEQVQRAASVLAGYSLGEADLLRRAMGKKDAEKMEKERKRFIEGCGKVNNIPPATAEAIFGFIEKFAQYGFNKSHSAAYGWISYQTAWLKARHPREFMAAMLSFDANDTDRLAQILAECRRMGLAVLPPDINSGELKFVPDPAGPGIRFGLGSIKNVGSGAMEAAVAERGKSGPFRSLEDFCRRLDSRTVNRKVLESLVKCGAFDSLEPNRAALFSTIEGAMASAASVQRDRASGQVSLFGDEPAAAQPKRAGAAKVEPWPALEILRHEKELLGYYVSGHPLDSYAGHFDSGKYNTVAEARAATEPGTFKLAGLVTGVEKRFSKKDSKPFGVFTLEDFTGALEVTAWDEAWAKNSALVVQGTAVAATVRVTRRDEMVRATASSISALKPKASVRPVRIRLEHARSDSSVLEALLEAAKKNPGKRPLVLEIAMPGGNCVDLHAGAEFSVAEEQPLLSALQGA